ncbi:MAG: nucleotide sugar dehydrogenase [Candidatus Anstonellales archaeon]
MKDSVISVIGLGKAGLPLACVIADAGLEVIGIDVDSKKVDMINHGINPLKEEPDLEELIKKHGGNKLKATTSYKEGIEKATFHILIVPLFLDANKKPDYSILDSATEQVGKFLKKDDVVVVETTLPVGTTEGRIKKILESKSKMKAGVDFHLGYSPERVMTGYAVSRYKEFPKVISGINEDSVKRIFNVYSKFVRKIVTAPDIKTAEMVKIAEGVYRDVNIAIANELYKVCKEYGIDFSIMKELAKHEYCNILEPGVGVGGHCIPVYPWFVIKNFEQKKPENVKLMKTAREVNDGMVDYWKAEILKRIKKHGKESKKAKICIYGLTYRPGVKETYGSRSLALYASLKKEGYNVYGWDDLLNQDEIKKLKVKIKKPEECDVVFDVFSRKIKIGPQS